jgi:hypothetical protein
MTTTIITTVDRLKEYLHRAMQLEHATIPPYLTALYSIHPGTNSDAYHILRVVVVEEMLHLTIAANLLSSITCPNDNGTRPYDKGPNLLAEGFVPAYPAYLPDGERDFQVHLERFSESAIDTFLKIERPASAPDESKRLIKRKAGSAQYLVACPEDEEKQYYSIGEFYEEIARGFKYLYEEKGPSLFCGDPKRQVTSEYYYSGGGELHPVVCMDSAQRAIDLIIGQGEGRGGGIYNKERELAHFYRFDQLRLGKYYRAGDKPDEPTGPELHVDWNAVFPIHKDTTLSDYGESSELSEAAKAFNRSYGRFLADLNEAYNGAPEKLLEVVPRMFRLRDQILQLMHNPLPGTEGQNAAPTFEVA